MRNFVKATLAVVLASMLAVFSAAPGKAASASEIDADAAAAMQKLYNEGVRFGQAGQWERQIPEVDLRPWL